MCAQFGKGSNTEVAAATAVEKRGTHMGAEPRSAAGDQLIYPSVPEPVPVASAQRLTLGLSAGSGTTRAKVVNFFRKLPQSRSLHMYILMKPSR